MIAQRCIIAWAPQVEEARHFQLRALFLTLEATLGHAFAFHDHDQIKCMEKSFWNPAILDYQGLCAGIAIRGIYTIQGIDRGRGKSGDRCYPKEGKDTEKEISTTARSRGDAGSRAKGTEKACWSCGETTCAEQGVWCEAEEESGIQGEDGRVPKGVCADSKSQGKSGQKERGVSGEAQSRSDGVE